jgi:zinc-finger of transposase IS204/IS1001/IS1096/IS1165
LPSQSAISAIPPAGVPAATAVAVLPGELFPHLAGLRIGQVKCAAASVEPGARSGSAGAACRACGTWSSRVHSGYARRIEDSPVGSRPVVIRLTVRRFFCKNPDCTQAPFAEQVEGLTARYRRRSVPLLGVLAQIGLALAGRAGARMTAVLGTAVHRTTLIRLVMALPEPQASTAPEVLGAGDFALRKGHVYGTVLVSIATGKAIGVLPDREAGTLEDWLRAHPGARVICRDRAGARAGGARSGAPDAIQVAGSWHRWHNLGEYAEKAVVAHHGCLKQPGPGSGDASGTPPGPGRPEAAPAAGPQPPPDGLRDACGRERRLVARTRERHAAVHDLLAAGQSLSAAGRALGLSRNTVLRFARAARADELLVKATSRETSPGPFKPYLNQRRDEGITDASVLHAELQARGWRGSARTACRYVRPFRQLPAPPPAPAVPKPARSPDGCFPAPPPSMPASRPSSPRSRPGARTWTPSPGTCAPSPR